jgi:hypothetical protein
VAFLEASRHDALRELRIDADDLGQPFLMGIVMTSDGPPIVLVSVSIRRNMTEQAAKE